MKKALIILILLIFVFSCTTKIAQNQTNQENKTVEKDEFSELKRLVLDNDWDFLEEQTSNLEIKRFKIQSKEKCDLEIRIKPDPNPRHELINPTINIIFEKKWTQEELNKEKEQRDKCIEQITKHPEAATGCPDLSPDINTEKYSIFIHSTDCNEESKDLKQKITRLLLSFQ